MKSVQKLTQQLINCKSVTPEDAGCQQLIADRLEKIGFEIHNCKFDDVDNLWAITPSVGDSGGDIFCFLGHTDVVPAGDMQLWNTDPFTATVIGDKIFGRGSSDMKSAIAAMVCALEAELKQLPTKARMAVLLTSDEEGVAKNGVKKVLPWLQQRNQIMKYCLVGEPSSKQQLGDTIKIGRRGSISGTITIKGVQGHVAYPQFCDNPIHKALPFLTQLSQHQWDLGNAEFAATSFQMVTMEVNNKAVNVVPSECMVKFNLRYSTELTAAKIKNTVQELLTKYKLQDTVEWKLSGEPFITRGGKLIEVIRQNIVEQLAIDPELSTTGGTSDGRFVAPYGVEVVEFGVTNDSIHKVNEYCTITDIANLQKTYQAILRSMLW